MTGIVRRLIATYEGMLRAKDDDVKINKVSETTVPVRKLIDFFEGTQNKTVYDNDHEVEEEFHSDRPSVESAPTQVEEESKKDKFHDERFSETLNQTKEVAALSSENLEAHDNKAENIANVSPNKSNSFEAASEEASSQTEEDRPDAFFDEDIIQPNIEIEDHATYQDEIEPNDVTNKTFDDLPTQLHGLGAPNPKPTGRKTTSRIRRMISVGRRRLGTKTKAVNVGHRESNKVVKENDENIKRQKHSGTKRAEKRGALSKFFSGFLFCLPSSEKTKTSGRTDAPTSVEITVPISSSGNVNQMGSDANLQIGLMVTSAVIKHKRDAVRTEHVPVTAGTNNSSAHTI